MKIFFLLIIAAALRATDQQIEFDNQLASQISAIAPSKKTKLPKSDCYPKPLNSVEIEGKTKPLFWFISEAAKKDPESSFKKYFRFYGATENCLGIQKLTTPEQLEFHRINRETREYLIITTFKKSTVESKPFFGSNKESSLTMKKYHVFFGTRDLSSIIGYLEDKTSKPKSHQNTNQNNANQ